LFIVCTSKKKFDVWAENSNKKSDAERREEKRSETNTNCI
jgi:hypothetical protein